MNRLEDLTLGIISDAYHYAGEDGELHTLEPLARQFEQWAVLFKDVYVCAPLSDSKPPELTGKYRQKNIALLPIHPAGGNTAQAKFDLLVKLPGWWKTIQQLLRIVQAVHIRCPNNISILGLLALQRSQHLKQAVYTGSWCGYSKEPFTYRWQRLYLRHFFSGPVAMYGSWDNQPLHTVSSFSPSYAEEDWQKELPQIGARIARLKQNGALPEPIRLISVGALNRNKNQQLIIRAVDKLREQNVQVKLDIIGDGEQRSKLIKLTNQLELRDQISFHGYLSQAGVRNSYRHSDFVVQPSLTEGFSKVPVEAMTHGVIPVLSNIGMNPQIVDGYDRGRCFEARDPSAIAQTVLELSNNTEEMIRLIKNGRDFANELTLESWRTHIRHMLLEHWND